VVSDTVPGSGGAVPGFSAPDVHGNQVHDSGTSAFLLLADGFTPAARLTAIPVAQGPASGGTPVTITGTGTRSGTPVASGKRPAAGTFRLKVIATFTCGTLERVVEQTLVLTGSWPGRRSVGPVRTVPLGVREPEEARGTAR